MLTVAGLNSFYGQAHILHDVAFASARARSPVLLGRNGAGKSTVMKSLIGLVRPATGQRAASPATTSRAWNRSAARNWAWATCRRSAASSPN